MGNADRESEGLGWSRETARQAGLFISPDCSRERKRCDSRRRSFSLLRQPRSIGSLGSARLHVLPQVSHYRRWLASLVEPFRRHRATTIRDFTVPRATSRNRSSSSRPDGAGVAGWASGCDIHLVPGAIRDSPCSPYSAAFSSLNSRDATHSAEGLSGRRSSGEQWKPRATLGVDHPIHPAEQFVVLDFSSRPDTYRVNAALWENARRTDTARARSRGLFGNLRRSRSRSAEFRIETLPR